MLSRRAAGIWYETPIRWLQLVAAIRPECHITCKSVVLWNTCIPRGVLLTLHQHRIICRSYDLADVDMNLDFCTTSYDPNEPQIHGIATPYIHE